MSRRLRLEIPGGVSHVTNRGVDLADIVRDDDDRREWFRLFHRADENVTGHIGGGLGLTVRVVAGQSPPKRSHA